MELFLYCSHSTEKNSSTLPELYLHQLQLLLLSFEHNIPGCTVLLLSRSRLTSNLFQLKPLRIIGMLCVKKRETAVQKIPFFSEEVYSLVVLQN